MGVNKLLRAGIENERNQLTKEEKSTQEVAIKPLKDDTKKTTTTKKDSTQKATERKVEEKVQQKNKGGRPTNKERGLKSRKQYTLTLKEDDYQTFLDRAQEEDISFAKFMERAAFEYIENHK